MAQLEVASLLLRLDRELRGEFVVAATETTLQDLLEGSKQYWVPLYQRPYQWGTKQLIQLWRDIEELAEARRSGEQTTHFIGSLVLAPAPKAVAGGISPWLVVDGQQRLTTLTLLLAAIRDYVSETDPESSLSDEIHNLYLINQYKKGSQRIKLVPTQADRPSYNAIIDKTPDAGGDDAIGASYRFFRGKIAAFDVPEDEHDIESLMNTVAEGLDLVSISTSPDDNVHRIFQSLNNTGLKLTQGDLIRNYIFMRLPNTGDQAYRQYWIPLQEILDNDEVEDLFWIDLAEEHPAAKISDTYTLHQRRLDKLETEEEVQKDLARILSLAKLYRLILRPELEENAAVRHRLQRLLDWQSSTPHPLMLRLLLSREQGFATDEQLESALHVIESYLVRRFVFGKPTQGLNRNFRQIVSSVSNDEAIDRQVLRWLSSGRRHFVGDQELRDAIKTNPYYRTGRVANRKIFLEWLEQEFHSKEPVQTETLTIEHIMPQTLSPEWRTVLEEGYPNEDVDMLYQQSLHTLGNLTLSGYNSRLSNRDFEWKKTELSKSGLRLNVSIISEEKWGPDEIMQRSTSLADLIIKAWPGPMTEQKQEVETSPRWLKLRQIMALIPSGHWTAYGDLAAAVGTAAQPVGNYLANNVTPNPHRVMRASGEVSSSFEWLESSADMNPREILEKEGLEFGASGKADPSRRLSPDELLDFLEEVEADQA